MRLRHLRHVLGRAFRHDPPAAVAALRPHVDEPVGGFDHVEVVLDDDDGVAGLAQLVQHLEQQLDVVEVQACGRLVEQVDVRAVRQLDREAEAMTEALAGPEAAAGLKARLNRTAPDFGRGSSGAEKEETRR